MDYDEVYFADACEPLEEAVANGEVELRTLARGTYPGTPLPAGVAEGIRTVGYWNANKPQRWGLDWHRNEGIEITLLDRGALTFSTRESSWDLRSGEITVTRPWQEHCVGNPLIGASHLAWIIVDVGVRRPHQQWNWPSWIGLSRGDLTRLTSHLQHNEKPVWAGSPEIRAAFNALQKAATHPDSLSIESELQLATGQLLLALLRTFDSQDMTADEGLTSPLRAVEMYLHELDSHLDHLWTLPEMARACGLGRSQFSGYVRQITNMSPVEFLTHRRILRAASDLQSNRSRSITDIAVGCGFQSSQYFATTFRRHYGISPREFRNGGLDTQAATTEPRTGEILTVS
ncbi:helix-turn-helix transcriptional regulator [Rathayibacter soli]|uniref:helix-turn-helix transcriptional regulator n=1 Tax=Rathayibacter soli TaxID=3144168 RepID=UPI0027E4A17E|nr:AraC family transcriptional regulator [Glaciibacter superstes]